MNFLNRITKQVDLILFLCCCCLCCCCCVCFMFCLDWFGKMVHFKCDICCGTATKIFYHRTRNVLSILCCFCMTLHIFVYTQYLWIKLNVSSEQSGWSPVSLVPTHTRTSLHFVFVREFKNNDFISKIDLNFILFPFGTKYHC